ncbi:SWIM zinc finger family protein [Bacillus sp. V33-4]|uniref:SWIM zinc finger family protein n=1 Tax=Bacillus sp. V33-4 TaxID=2054169 RepID=UPI000C763500|nr:SWIM zinc finger family protein [Bacillus sp. V33-4]PLR85433.1 hypothetical protein CVD23_08635 [Bacillus sp. V33-4]
MTVVPDYYIELLQFGAAKMNDLLIAGDERDDKLVQKGFMLYRQGLVSKLKMDQEIAHASVQDVTPARVNLDLSFPELSECSCPGEGICRHQLAVFFQAYSHVGSVAEWIEEWRQPVKDKKAAATWGMQRAKDLLKSTGSLKPDYDKWVNAFTESFNSIMTGNGEPKPYVFKELFEVYVRRLRAGAPVEAEWRTLYELVGALHAFSNVSRISKDFGHTEEMINRYYRHVSHFLIEEIEDAVNKLSIHSLPFAFDAFVSRLKDDSILLLEDENESAFWYEGIYLYRFLWTNFFKRGGWREQETAKLEKLSKINGSISLSIGLAHQYVLTSKDEAALDILNSLGMEAAPYYLVWLEMLTGQKAWKRMVPYTELFIQYLREYVRSLREYRVSREFTELSLRAIMRFCTENGRTDLYERALLYTLPYSYMEYEQFLFEHGLYEKWGELISYIGFDIGLVSNERIKSIQKESPSVLLPLYHQSIQKNIDMKSRGNYQEAVRYLKKLRTIYKKIGLVSEWEEFMEELLFRTKRLRAFHEECKRSKLIHA